MLAKPANGREDAGSRRGLRADVGQNPALRAFEKQIVDLLEDHGPENRRTARASHGLKVAHERIENFVGQVLHIHALLCVAAVRGGPEFGRLGEELRDDRTVKTNGERQEGLLGRGVPDLIGAGKVERHDDRLSRAVDDGASADEAFLLAAEP